MMVRNNINNVLDANNDYFDRLFVGFHGLYLTARMS